MDSCLPSPQTHPQSTKTSPAGAPFRCCCCNCTFFSTLICCCRRREQHSPLVLHLHGCFCCFCCRCCCAHSFHGAILPPVDTRELPWPFLKLPGAHMLQCPLLQQLALHPHTCISNQGQNYTMSLQTLQTAGHVSDPWKQRSFCPHHGYGNCSQSINSLLHMLSYWTSIPRDKFQSEPPRIANCRPHLRTLPARFILGNNAVSVHTMPILIVSQSIILAEHLYIIICPYGSRRN